MFAIKMSTKMSTAQENSSVYIFITNIPKSFHTADLRNFFSQFVESQGFECFHFRHRPSIRKLTNDSANDEVNPAASASRPAKDISATTTGSTCCLVRLQESKISALFRRYHGKHWMDSEGQSLNQRCVVSRIKFSDGEQHTSNATTPSSGRPGRKLGSRQIPIDRVAFTLADIQDLAELKPPPIMPQGNVGTPTATFLDLIQKCRMPGRLIGKLGLVFPKSKGRRQYSSVPFVYRGTETTLPGQRDSDCSEEDDDVQTARGHTLSHVILPETPQASGSSPQPDTEDSTDNPVEEDNDDDEEDGAAVEEWERHEAFYDNVTEQDRTKERLFEKEIELKWEKGGSGLVYYTDAQYWDEQKGDFDERTTDELDVDVSVYYDKDGGDMDARDYVQLRREGRWRNGEESESAFEKGIGKFEKHTKGIGRKLMEQQGWSEGQGLGKTVQGMADALDNEGKHPRDKRGLGFHGEKHVRFGLKKKIRKEVNILTIYDDPREVDQPEPLLRRNEETFVKHRTNPVE